MSRRTGYAQNLTTGGPYSFLIFFPVSLSRLFRMDYRWPRLNGNVKAHDTYGEFDSLRRCIQLRARELNRMKEATDYAGPPIAACRRRRRRRFNRSSESKFKCSEESRRNIISYANDRFCVHLGNPSSLGNGGL